MPICAVATGVFFGAMGRLGRLEKHGKTEDIPERYRFVREFFSIKQLPSGKSVFG